MDIFKHALANAININPFHPKRQKTSGFLTYSGGIERGLWRKKG